MNLIAAAGLPFQLVSVTGNVLASGIVGEWFTVERSGTLSNATVDMPDGSLLLVQLPLEGVNEGEQARHEA